MDYLYQTVRLSHKFWRPGYCSIYTAMDKPAPDFSLPDQDGKIRSLSDYKGRWLVLYFYPRDNAVNCTREACAFRDEHAIIGQFGNAEVVGINKDSVASHKKFATKHHLNFLLLSDSSREITKAYGAWRSSPAKLFDRPFGTRRNTYIINPEGMIVKQYINVDPKNHTAQIIHSEY
jgi:peroxiredoxin Q/BCP